MDELVKAFQKFLMRDLSYIIGGSAVVLSFLSTFDKLPTESTPIVWYVIGVPVAYVVGYAIQDFFGVCHLLRMRAGHPDPNRMARMLYELYDHEPPKAFERLQYDRGKKVLYESNVQRFKDDHERIEGLKQVGFTVGWCFIVSAILLMVRDCLAYIGFDRALIGALLILGIILILLGWLKVTQQAQYVLRFSKENREGNN